MAQMSELRFSFSNQVFVVIGILSTLLSNGLGIGFLPIIVSDEINGSNHKLLDEQSLSYLEAAGELAFIASILIIPLTMQKKGRKVANIVTIMPAFLGWVLSFNAGKFFSLVIINALHNISLGGAVSISSTLMSEFCSFKYTGLFFMIEIAMITLGILLCHICNVGISPKQ
ncbi:uncharacterized protein LOC114351468 [Ostrinia furnacalis]|uniref:uncharacterized protein LOC114351468 n=1 Tax=Ostrinia furnacalis TaxID=93504 RepID=UPI0010400108|nr:uncharacterized protein LOC114351468 [Ostrinia furnacalis]